ALAVRLLADAFVRAPGYIDAYYSFHVGARVAAGAGLSETVAWNYLTPPQRLPRPAGAYWPPGTALLAAAGLSVSAWLLPRDMPPWRAAQLLPVLLSAAVA